MDVSAKPDLAEQIAGALAWWREAGVDVDFVAEPRSWLDRPDARTMDGVEPIAAPPPPPLPAAPLPADLASFVDWWLTDPSLPGEPARRVPPRGKAGARIMVLAAVPGHGDERILLAGPQGKLLSGILAALGWAEGEVYVASALPAHDPVPDWAALTAGRLGYAVLHHVSLVAPERVLILGANVLPLIGHDMANRPTFLHDINHEARRFPVLAELDLAALIAQPRLKAGLWGRLLEWTGSRAT
jgi:uracil-DNA glycosylase